MTNSPFLPPKGNFLFINKKKSVRNDEESVGTLFFGSPLRCLGEMD
jgi:hypothetical protein